MKKALFIIVALASVAIGCTKSEVVKAPGRGREIKFDTYLGNIPVTKAESVDTTYLRRPAAESGGVHVYAFLHTKITDSIDVTDNSQLINGSGKILDVSSVPTNSAYMDKILTWDTTDLKWDYPGVVYWPDYSSTRKLAFVAYALNAETTVGSENLIVWDNDPNVAANDKSGHPEGQSYTKFTYTVPNAVKDQKDLLVTPFEANQGLDENANATAVRLNFKHLLSRVGFQVVANQDGDVDIDIKEITLYGKFPRKGKVDLMGRGAIAPITTDVDAAAEYVNEYTFFQSEKHYFSTKSSKTATNIFENRLITTATNLNPDDGEGGNNTKFDVDTLTNDSNRFMMIMPSVQSKNDADGDGVYELDTENGLPGAYIEVVYQLTDADVQTARVSLDGFKFDAGKSYTFRFKVSTLSIEFDVTVDSWLEHFEEKDENGILTNGDGTYTLMPIA